MGRGKHLVPVRIGAKLRKIRRAFDTVNKEGELEEFSQNDMVKKLGFSADDGIYRSSISGYELGKRMPPYYMLLAYAELANVHLEVLVDDMLDLSLEQIPYKVKSDGVRRLFG